MEKITGILPKEVADMMATPNLAVDVKSKYIYHLGRKCGNITSIDKDGTFKAEIDDDFVEQCLREGKTSGWSIMYHPYPEVKQPAKPLRRTE